MTRPDLLALDEDALAALTNRGLVKRAAKAVDAGEVTEVSASDTTVTGVFADGVTTSVGPGPLTSAACSCGAQGACRHVLAVVLAYQRQARSVAAPDDSAAGTPAAASLEVGGPGAAAATEVGTLTTAGPGTLVVPAAAEVAWSPAEFTDEALTRLLGARTLTAARRVWRAGYAAKIRRGRVPQVELPACTVQFLVPHQLDYTHTDAAAGSGQESVALAVWAFQAAEEQDAAATELHLQVGGAAQRGTEFAYATDLATEVLLDGVSTVGSGLAGSFTLVRQSLEAATLRWPLLAVEELEAQLAAYAQRSAAYRAEAAAELVAEVHARRRSSLVDGGSPRNRVLGTDEAAETLLRRLRLTGLGCRVLPGVAGPEAKVFLADPDNGNILVLRHRLDGRVAGMKPAALAGGNVVTESAVRSASRQIRFAQSRLGKTTVSPSAGAWEDLPPGILVHDLDALAAQLALLPPRLIRPRIEAESVRVLAVGSVGQIGYAPGDQVLTATITGARGGEATISLTHQPAAEGALDALAAALADEPAFISATVRRARGTIVAEPLAVVCASGVVIPDLAPGKGDASLELGQPPRPDPLAAAVTEALALLADTVHKGLRHLPATYAQRLTSAAEQLAKVGLRLAAEDLSRLAKTLPQPEMAGAAWVDAQIRLLTIADLLGPA